MALPGEKVAENMSAQAHYEGSTSFTTAYTAAVYAESLMRSSMTVGQVTDELNRHSTPTANNAAVVCL